MRATRPPPRSTRTVPAPAPNNATPRRPPPCARRSITRWRIAERRMRRGPRLLQLQHAGTNTPEQNKAPHRGASVHEGLRDRNSLLRVGDLHHLAFLAVLSRRVHLEHLDLGAGPSAGHARIDLALGHRVIPAAGETAGAGIVAAAFAEHHAGRHAVVPGRPVLAADVVIAMHAVAGERLTVHLRLDFLDQHAA